MTITVIDPVKVASRDHVGKQVLHDSPNYHVWIHGPDEPRSAAQWLS